MTLFYAFLVGGLICLIGQLILDNTNLSAGHVTSIFVVLGTFLGFIGIYPQLINLAHAGANIPITSFGNLLYEASYLGFKENGILGMFTNMFSTTGGVITAVLIFSFIFSLIWNPKD